MTQRDLMERQGGQAARKQTSAAKQNPPPVPDCIHRSFAPVGKIKCNCSHQPEVFGCEESWIVSGYCMKTLPVQPGDGPIVMPDGSLVTPADDRMQSFVPWPLRDGDTPAPWNVIVCQTCPRRKEPPPHLATIRRLGIRGDFEPETGRCDILNVATDEQQWVQHAVDWHNSAPSGMRSCYANRKKLPSIVEMIEATACRLLACHTTICDPSVVEAAAMAFPSVKFWVVYHGSQVSMNVNSTWMRNQTAFLAMTKRLSNVWYGTPEPTAPFARLGYDRFQTWPNTIPFEMPTEPLSMQDPPVLAIAGRGDVIKAHASAVLAAGLVAKQRPIVLESFVKDASTALNDLATAAGISIAKKPYLPSSQFREHLRRSVSVVLDATMTEATQYVGLDALSQGRPVVGSQTIRYLPREWQADPNDPADIARVALMFLDDYPRYSAEALRLGGEIRDRQRDAYHAAIERILNT